MLDISASGAAFKTDWWPETGSTVEIRFTGMKPVKGQVVRHMEEGFAVTAVWGLQSEGNRRKKSLLSRLFRSN